MTRLLKWSLLGIYYYSLAMGLLRFRYDRSVGRAYRTRGITAYSVAINLAMVATVQLIFQTTYLEALKSRSDNLHELLYIFMMWMRTGTVLLNLAFNWRYRNEIVAIVEHYHSLNRAYFRRYQLRQPALRKFVWLIVAKVGITAVADPLQAIMALVTIGSMLDWQGTLSVMAVQMFSHCLNMYLNYYFISLLFLAQALHLLNDQIARILREAEAAEPFDGRRRGGFLQHCCRLADELDEVAVVLRGVVHLSQRVSRIFSFQGMFNLLNIHMVNVITLFFAYITLRDQHKLQNGMASLLLMGSAGLLNYADIWILCYGSMEILAAFGRTLHLVHSGVPGEMLDERLEQSIHRFSLQLATDPLVLKSQSMFLFNWSFIFSIFTSTITRTLFLIQYDYKYFAKK